MANTDHKDHTELEGHTAQLVHNVYSTELEHTDNKVHTLATRMDKGENRDRMVHKDHLVWIQVAHNRFRTDHRGRVQMVQKALLSHTVRNSVQHRDHRKVRMVHSVLVRTVR